MRGRMSDKMREQRIVVLYGGESAEREVSLRSGAAVLASLARQGFNVTGIDTSGEWIAALQQGQYEHAFIALHGRGGEDGSVQGLLELLHLPYTGSGVLASAVAMDKWRSKLLWRGAGLPTPPAVALTEDNCRAELLQQLGGEVMVKPAREGSSLGMSRVNCIEQLYAAWQQASRFDTLVIAEQWITGDEYTIAIVADSALPVIKLETGHIFYDYSAKYLSGDTRYLIPCGLEAVTEQALQQLALRAYHALGCQGWGRVDLMVDSRGQSWLLEVNSVPGMTEHSLVPKAAAAAGIDFDQLLVNILTATATGGDHG
ncbi:D-alanine--D-alanine ligase [Ectothiorhodospiraceae bacterium BW-2]|nr:D-alanine--D-alanine ligase [Ectothiorhodospiraceae bacterium BW-2]